MYPLSSNNIGQVSIWKNLLLESVKTFDVISHRLRTDLINEFFMWQNDFARVNNEPLDQTRLCCIKHTGTLLSGYTDRTLSKHFHSFICSYPSKIRVYSARTLRTFPAVSSQIKPEIFPRVDLFSSFNCVTEAWDKMLIDCFQQGSCDENIYSPMEEKKKAREKGVINTEPAGTGCSLNISCGQKLHLC